MLAFGIVNLLLINSILAGNDGWIPIAKPIVLNHMTNDYTETRRASAWKPSQDISNSILDYAKEEAIQQVQAKPFKKSVITAAAKEVITETAIVTSTINKSLEQKDVIDRFQDQDQSLSKAQLRDERHNKHSITHTHQRTSKQSRSLSLTEDLISTVQTLPGQNIKTTSKLPQTIINKNVKNNTKISYEVTEPSNVQDLSQNWNDGRHGYFYQQPQAAVLPVSATENAYTNKFVNFLSKYNINARDMLSNYDRSKLHVNNKLDLYPSHVPSISLVPFRYNSLNHRPVDPVLAVLLSNYGYYLQGFYGLPNNYKNLFGYSASNNIHNNKPFGSYKIYSDTDSSI